MPTQLLCITKNNSFTLSDSTPFLKTAVGHFLNTNTKAKWLCLSFLQVNNLRMVSTHQEALADKQVIYANKILPLMNFTNSARNTQTQNHITTKLENPGLSTYWQKSKESYNFLRRHWAMGCKGTHWSLMKTLFPSFLVYVSQDWQVTNSWICLTGTTIVLETLTVAWASSILHQPHRRTALCQGPPDTPQPPGGTLLASVWVLCLFLQADSCDQCHNFNSFFVILWHRYQCIHDNVQPQIYCCKSLRFKEIKPLADGHEHQVE